ncbi:MAG: hypothetical protein Phyf2KO_26900 [Phycisphaerales bacterium]
MSSKPDNTIQPGALCINCSYDLAGLQESALCPECGYRSPDRNNLIVEKLDIFCFCVSCGYHLVDLNHTDNCPECGLACKDSLVEQSLYRSGSGYIKTLRRGYRNIRTGYILLFVGLLFVIFGSSAIAMMSQLAGTNSAAIRGNGFVPLVFLLIMLAGGIMLIVGAHAATKTDPHLGLHASSERTRVLTRAWSYTNFFFYIPGAFCLPLTFFVAFVRLNEQIGATLLLLLYFGSAVTLVLTSSYYTLHITQRLGTRSLAKSCKRIATTLVALAVIAGFLFLPLAGMVATTTPGAGTATVGISFTVGCFTATALHFYMVCRATSGLNAALKRCETIPNEVNSVPGAFTGTSDPPPNNPDHIAGQNDINRIT